MQKYKVRKGGIAKLVFATPPLSNTQLVFYLKEVSLARRRTYFR